MRMGSTSGTAEEQLRKMHSNEALGAGVSADYRSMGLNPIKQQQKTQNLKMF